MAVWVSGWDYYYVVVRNLPACAQRPMGLQTHHKRQLAEALRLAILPASQMRHAAEDVAPTLLEALPAMHSVQLLCATSAW